MGETNLDVRVFGVEFDGLYFSIEGFGRMAVNDQVPLKLTLQSQGIRCRWRRGGRCEAATNGNHKTHASGCEEDFHLQAVDPGRRTNRHRGSGRPLSPATRHVGPHRAVQRVTQGHRTAKEDRESRSRRVEVRWTRPGCSPHARGCADYPPFVRRVPYQPRVGVTSRTVAGHASIASRSWIANDALSIYPLPSAAKESDRSPPPSGCEEDFHLQAIEPARRTTKRRRLDARTAWEVLGLENTRFLPPVLRR
jgi:hypothetical protein